LENDRIDRLSERNTYDKAFDPANLSSKRLQSSQLYPQQVTFAWWADELEAATHLRDVQSVNALACPSLPTHND
jgi:hypothetical protein